jgi:predicted dehydrogenase
VRARAELLAEMGDGRREPERGVAAYADIKHALPHVAALVIAAPPTSHAALAPQAIAAGQHVLIEIPRTRVKRCARPRVAHERKTTHTNRAE